MRNITIIRKKGHYGASRALKLFVDSQYVGCIRQGERITLAISDEACVLVGKIDWAKTKPFSLHGVRNGDELSVKAWFTLNPLRNIGLLNMPLHIESNAV